MRLADAAAVHLEQATSHVRTLVAQPPVHLGQAEPVLVNEDNNLAENRLGRQETDQIQQLASI